MRKLVLLFLIITISPSVVLAHEGEVHFNYDAGTLPGERGYFWERIGEWFALNLFTISTKGKQEKSLRLADERVAEFLELLTERGLQPQALQETLRRYAYFLRRAEDMAEKIIFLDGAEIGLAEKLEQATRLHEEVLAQLLPDLKPELRSSVNEGLITARNENEKIFRFMVKNYQSNETDIDKHRRILEEHIELIGRLLREDNSNAVQIRDFRAEARKFQAAGLNLQAYDLIQKAKNVLY